MKRSLIAIISAAVAVAFGACDQHSWEDSKPGAKDGTNVIYEEHGHGGDHEGGKHDKGHEEKGHHPKGEADEGGTKDGDAGHPEKVK